MYLGLMRRKRTHSDDRAGPLLRTAPENVRGETTRTPCSARSFIEQIFFDDAEINFETDKLPASEDSNRSPKRSAIRRRETKFSAADTNAEKWQNALSGDDFGKAICL
jgi:hypothetical protein